RVAAKAKEGLLWHLIGRQEVFIVFLVERGNHPSLARRLLADVQHPPLIRRDSKHLSRAQPRRTDHALSGLRAIIFHIPQLKERDPPSHESQMSRAVGARQTVACL